MNPQSIIDKLDQCVVALSRGNIEMKRLGLEKAKTERLYRIEQAKQILALKLLKHPATLIMEIVKGDEIVSQLRLDKDVAESSYYTCISAIDNLRIEIDINRSKLTWLRTELNNS